MKKSIRILCVSAVMIALSFVLSFVKIIQMPLGGSVTLLSTLPLVMLSLFYGVKKSALPCFAYGVIQCLCGMIFEGSMGWVNSILAFFGMALLDYILAFGSLCVSGAFANKGTKGIIGGIALSFVLRYISHVISGTVIFTSYDMLNSPIIWSLAYNGTFLLPEMIFTLIGAIIITKLGVFEKLKRLADE